MTVEVRTRHPLDPLDPAEIARAAELLRAHPGFQQLDAGRVRFITVELCEPAKDELARFQPGGPVARSVKAVLLDNSDGGAYEAVLSVDAGAVTSFRRVPGVQPAVMVSEILDAEAAVRRDPEFREALARRGIDDPAYVQIDPWPAGNFGYGDEEGVRLARAVMYVREDELDNAYAHPIENLIVLVDLNRMKVIRVEDHGMVPVPPEPGRFSADAVGALREGIRPLEISQPEGPSFTVDGHLVRWQKWSFRVGFSPREGLVLHALAYRDGERDRSILQRASVSEMVVPYGDPSPTHYFKSVFDAGENGIGIAATTLERGCDCLGEIYYFDAAIADQHGAPVPIPRAICMHEEDHGVLWRHLDWRNGNGEVRRSRRLVVSSFSSIGNYDYGFFWYLYQDGSIEFEVKLTGVLSTGAVTPGERPAHGALIAPQLNGMVHQHFFNVRLDFDLDGEANAVEEVWAEPSPPGTGNPHGNAFKTCRRRFTRESEARRVIDPLSARAWEVVNPTRMNALGSPVAYRLTPGENVLPFAQPESAVMRRAGFIAKHLWVTPYRGDERFASGEYPYQHAGGAGLPEWTAADRSIEDTDLVVWYTFGHHHVPRPEDWPVMPVAYIGFKLKPNGFFDRNPALDVPPPTPHCGQD